MLRDILVEETIEIDANGDALCSRTYIFMNDSDTKQSLPKTICEEFDNACNNFILFDSQKRPVSGAIDIKKQSYQKLIYLDFKKDTIPAKSEIRYTLEYKWNKFFEANRFKIHYRPENRCSYKLVIDPKSDIFKNHYIISKIDDKFEILKKEANYRIKDKTFTITLKGRLLVDQQICSKNREFSLELEASVREIRLPQLEYYSKRYTNNIFSDCVILLIQHLLRDFIPFVEALHQAGAQRENIFIISIPYSVKEPVFRYLETQYKHIWRSFEYPFDEIVEEALKNALVRCENTNKKLLIIEDGGYAVPMLHSKYKDKVSLCFGAVEQTTHGIWRDKEVEDLKIPIIDVARSEIKRELESPLIGKAIVMNIDLLLSKIGISLTNKKILLIGFGNVGSKIAEWLRKFRGKVWVYDTQDDKLNMARQEKFKIIKNIHEGVKDKQIIIGATGKKSFGFNELTAITNDVYFINATSKLMEMDYEELNALAAQSENISGVGRKYKLHTGYTIYLLANGFPVNFFDPESQSVPDLEIQFIPTLLFNAAIYLLEKRIGENGIFSIPEDIQKDLRDTYQKFRS